VERQAGLPVARGELQGLSLQAQEDPPALASLADPSQLAESCMKEIFVLKGLNWRKPARSRIPGQKAGEKRKKKLAPGCWKNAPSPVFRILATAS